MLQVEHSAIFSTFIKLIFVIKIFVLSIFEWLFYTGFTVSPSRCCERPDALLPEPNGCEHQCIGSSTAPRVDNFDCCPERYEIIVLLPNLEHTKGLM